MHRQLWENLSERQEPSWYLDPITALQKREAHLRVIREWASGTQAERVLKTDLFEEAFGNDSILESLFPESSLTCGLDAAFPAARSASMRHEKRIHALVGDIRHLAVKNCSFDVVVSTSTLDHFESRADFLLALGEIGRVLKPGGLCIITLDNPWNPLYHPLRWFSHSGAAPFPLGYTESTPQLERDLAALGLQPEKRGWLLHNPRGLSTLLILGFRKMLRRQAADRLIHLFLKTCERLNNLPTRKVTACFLAVAARKSPRKESSPNAD